MKSSYQEYSHIEVTTEVASASSHRQIQLLLEKLLHHLEMAKVCITANQMKKKHEVISKALDIILYLRSCLNFKEEAALALSNQLDGIYQFSEKNLLLANLKNNTQFIDEIIKPLNDIKIGWDGLTG